MKIDVVMPKMGESLQEGTIIKWLKQEGDVVERDEMILEISTDKVDTEVPSPNSGVLTKILAKEEETVEVGTVIAQIETEASTTGANSSATEDSEPVEAESTSSDNNDSDSNDSSDSDGDYIDLVMPKMGESLQEGTITTWLKKVGDKIERDEMVLEISTDKVDTEVPSPVAGTLAEILYKEEETVEVGTVIARISSSGSVKKQTSSTTKSEAKPQDEDKKEETPKVASSSQPQTTATVQGNTFDIPRKSNGKFFSPLVRAIAEDNKVSLEELISLNGSGIDGRITKDDLNNYVQNRGSQPQTSTQSTTTSTSNDQQSEKPSFVVPSFSGGDSEVIPMDRIRQKIAEHMVYSKQTSAHVTSVMEVDVSGIVQYREANKDAFLKREGTKLTYTPFFVKALIDAVKMNPMVNVSVDGKNIIKHNRLNVGIATALPDGNLIVPVIKNADNLSLTGIAKSIDDLANRARNKKLNPDDIQGGTITLTNVGTFGTMFGTPVINQPQVAILGVGAIKKTPVVRQFDGSDAIVIRDIMYVSITYDHRVIDGMLAGKTLSTVGKILESMNGNTISL